MPNPRPGDHTLWVLTEPTLDGSSYAITLNVEDRARGLTPDEATRYALAVLRAANIADHDAATLALLCKIGLPSAEAGHVIAADLRPDRAPLDHEATAPLRYLPGVSTRTSQGFLTVELDGTMWGQFTVNEARSHALGVLDAISTADLDHALHVYLVGTVEVPDETARAAIQDLQQHREAHLAPVPARQERPGARGRPTGKGKGKRR